MKASDQRVLKGGRVYLEGKIQEKDLYLHNGLVYTDPPQGSDSWPVLDCRGLHIFPGFVDLHVHFREPGQEYKETIETGSMAAAHGGYTTVCTMPNLNPVPDSLDHLKIQLDRIREKARVHVLPYGSITQGEKGRALSDFDALAPYVVAFTDDGVGVDSERTMEEAMVRAKALGKAIVAHAEDRDLVAGGVIHDGDYAKVHGHKGNPSASEYVQVRRDLALAEKTGVHYHVCHVSTKESVQAIREAKEKGVKASFETAPHYLTLTDRDLQEDGRFKMNPPIRSEEDREALRQAMVDGALSAIATDHAPHSQEEKAGGLDHSLNGIVGLETAFPVCYTDLVKGGITSLENLVDLLSTRPTVTLGLHRIRDPHFVLAPALGIQDGGPADLTLFDLEEAYRIDPRDFLSKGQASPFTRKTVYGRCLATWVAGQRAYADMDRLEGREVSHEPV